MAQSPFCPLDHSRYILLGIVFPKAQTKFQPKQLSISQNFASSPHTLLAVEKKELFQITLLPPFRIFYSLITKDFTEGTTAPYTSLKTGSPAHLRTEINKL